MNKIKRATRARMAATGETYSTARMHVLADHPLLDQAHVHGETRMRAVKARGSLTPLDQTITIDRGGNVTRLGLWLDPAQIDVLRTVLCDLCPGECVDVGLVRIVAVEPCKPEREGGGASSCPPSRALPAGFSEEKS